MVGVRYGKGSQSQDSVGGIQNHTKFRSQQKRRGAINTRSEN